MSPKLNFSKPWCSYADQVSLLANRGLEISDRPKAEKFLSHLNYYRFSGYCLAFESQRHVFLPGTTFEHVMAAYTFDLHLRDLLTEALEVVEVDFRAAIAYYFSRDHGAFGHTDINNFDHRFNHAELMAQFRKEAERSNEMFVTHFSNTYSEFPDLPVWMATEVASFGCMSKMFEGLRSIAQGSIAKRYSLQPFTLSSIMHHFVYVRNICAHHCRLWDRFWAIRPTLPAGKKWEEENRVDNRLCFATLLLLRLILSKIPSEAAFASEWKIRVESQLEKQPECPHADRRLGLIPDWKAHPAWL